MNTIKDLFIKKNPVFVLALGLYTIIFASQSVTLAVVMGMLMLVLLVCLSIITGVLKKLLNGAYRFGVYIVLAAILVTILQLLMKAYMPIEESMLGIALPMLLVNSALFYQADVVVEDGFGKGLLHAIVMGIVYALSMIIFSFVCELFATGGIAFSLASITFNFSLIPTDFTLPFLTQPFGVLCMFGVFAAIVKAISTKKGDA